MLDGARSPDFGVPDVDVLSPLPLRVFETGNAGSAVVGGASEGRVGRGIEFDDMVTDISVDPDQ